MPVAEIKIIKVRKGSNYKP